MSAIVLLAIFAASGVLALSAIDQSLRRYGRVALALRAKLRECDEWRHVTVTVYEIKVHRAGAVILQPTFKAGKPTHPPYALSAAA